MNRKDVERLVNSQVHGDYFTITALAEAKAALQALLSDMDKAREALEKSLECISAHSQRLGVALESEGNEEPQFAMEATYTSDKISEALAATERWKA